MSNILSDPLMRGLEGILDLRLQQHALVSSNLANQATPGYRAKFLDFESALQAELDAPKDWLTSDPRHLSPEGMGAAPVFEIEPEPDGRVDQNTVNPEEQMATLQENSLLYRAVAEGVGRRFGLLQIAVGGK